MHAAIIAAEVRRTINPRRKVDLQGFMLMDPRKRARGTVAAFIETLKAAAGGRKHVSEAIKRPVRSKAVKRGSRLGAALGPVGSTVKPTRNRTRQGK